jgi:cation diffusion facilitator CzcD-associated flavoprotein CzcO
MSNSPGICVSQFPNFLIMFGPNSAAPWANLTTVFETQANYICKVVRHIKHENSRADGNHYAMMVDKEVQLQFNEWIQANMGPLAIISPNCSNYYTVFLDLDFY